MVDRVSKQFVQNGHELWAVKSISFKVAPGEFLCLVGPSGCGKTTLLRIIAALETPTKGRVTLDGSPSEEQRDKIGFVFQGFTLFPWRTIIDNVVLGLEVQGIDKEQRLKRGHELLDLVGLSKFSDAYPNQLSGGMQKLAAIARALAPDPEVLLCDEPFVNIDAQSRNLMQNELLRIWKATGKTIIFVTHNVDEAAFLGDRIFVLKARPARIKEKYELKLPRPRKRTDSKLVTIRQAILDDLREEVQL